jgi:hypothetical protein
MPGARCTRGLVCKIVRRNAHEHTGSAEAIRHSLRNGLTAYAALSSATNSSCHRRQRIDGSPQPGWADSPPRTWRQQRASGPHGFAVREQRRSSCVPYIAHESCSPCDHLARRRIRVHRIPSRVRDDRDTPLLGDEMARADRTDLPDGESEIFWREGTGLPKSA